MRRRGPQGRRTEITPAIVRDLLLLTSDPLDVDDVVLTDPRPDPEEQVLSAEETALWEEFLGQQDEREQRIVRQLKSGTKQKVVARSEQVAAARISQLMTALLQRWRKFLARRLRD